MENFAEKYRGAGFLALFLGTITLAVVIVMPFLPALLWAVVMSILMNPMYRRLVDYFGQKRGFARGARSWASTLTTIVTLLIICVPFVLIGIGLYAQFSSFVTEFGAGGQGGIVASVLDKVDMAVRPLVERFGTGTISLADYAKQNGPEIVSTLRAPISHAAARIAFTGLSLIIALLTMFFMLRDGEKLREPAYELLPLPPDRTEAILKRIGETVYAVFIGTVLMAIFQGVVLGMAFMMVGVPNAFLLGVMAVFLCTIPLVGATIIYVPSALILLAQGDWPHALVIGIVGFGLTKIDYIFRPMLIGGRTNLHPIGIFFGVLGGVFLFGPVGLVAGPMVLAVLLALQDVVREKVRATATESAAVAVKP